MSSELAPIAWHDKSARTDEITYSPDVPRLIWFDWPEETKSASPRGVPLVHFEQYSSWMQVDVDGQPHDIAVAWRVFDRQVFVARAVTPVARPGEPFLAPNWRHLESFTYTATGPTTVTKGKVASRIAAKGDRAVVPPGLHGEDYQAPETLALLPPVVQAGLRQAIPHPTLMLGSSYGSGADALTSNSLLLLRMDERRAVAVSAVKGFAARPANMSVWRPEPPEYAERDAAMPWEVTQYTYSFAAGQLSASSSVPRIAST